ncbi:DUF4393 domain-containing protein [Clostridium butyricum]|uniref:DUF4393 domain-containing protein n=1 Tax=Clostridium butyricum TaxID=1492 RepID=UPI00210644A9|nr:DUF4393 domain-containing protein [Clostridium butyricum]MCQ2026827.1 DUF4393 domain-containing protein [Clostridium butyricum]
MSDDIIKEAAIEVFKEQADKIYTDGFKPATQEAGEALQTIVGLFNNVILYPLKKLNYTFKYKYNQFEQDLVEKTKNIPKQNIIEPPLNVVGPTIEALKYTIDTEELREMYLNLLVSSINIDTVEYSHPGYVDIIKQMSSLDAKIFKIIVDGFQIPCSRVDFCFSNQMYTKAMPKIFAPKLIIENYDPFLISSSVENLCRLGLVTHYDNGLLDYDYNKFKEHDFVKNRFELFKTLRGEMELEIKVTEEALRINDFGANFAKVCL